MRCRSLVCGLRLRFPAHTVSFTGHLPLHVPHFVRPFPVPHGTLLRLTAVAFTTTVPTAPLGCVGFVCDLRLVRTAVLPFDVAFTRAPFRVRSALRLRFLLPHLRLRYLP